MLGNTMNGEPKLKKISDGMKIEPEEIKDRKSALEHLDKKYITEVNDLVRQVRKITESLPKKIVLSGKRTESIRRLLTLQANAEAAYDWISKDFKATQAKIDAASNNRCKKLREDCNRNKQAIVDKKEENIKKKKQEIDKENMAYTAYVSKMVSAQKKKYSELETHCDEQIKGAIANWEKEFEKSRASFVSYMEEQYPSAKMNAWINKFWYHPQRVEDYSRIAESENLNVLIGMATVDITDWVSGRTGSVVRKVLTNYITLFGRNRQQANESYKANKILLPYCISIEKGDSLMLFHDDDSDERAKLMVNGMAIRIMRSVPPCTMRFTLFDAAGMRTYGALKALDPALLNNPSEPMVKSLVMAESRQHDDMTKSLSDMEKALSEIESQLNNYSSIREFNNANPLSRQIYRPLLMASYPYGFDEENLRTLNKLIADCSRLGFFLIASCPDRAWNEADKNCQSVLKEIYSRTINLRIEKSGTIRVLGCSSAIEKSAAISIYAVPKKDAVDEIIEDIRKRSVEASRVEIRFTDAKGIMPSKNNWFTGESKDGVSVPVGYMAGGQPFSIQFDGIHVNTIIMGNTGTGKTNFLHVLLMNMMLRYDPSVVMIYLIDFKYGTDFSIYTQYNLPNFKTIGINSDPEFALEMLKSIEKEHVNRANKMGSRYHKISEYNADHPEDRINRIIVIIDELYVLSQKADDSIRKDILDTINNMVHQDRAFGIHFVLCGQDLDTIDKFDTINSQCSTKIALKCNDDRVRTMMDDAAVDLMHSIDSTDRGACIFSISKEAAPHTAHFAVIDTKSQAGLLEEIHNHYLDAGVMTDVKIMLTNVKDNPNHPLQMFVSDGYVSDIGSRLFVGEPVSCEREVNLHPAGNLWIAGGYLSDEGLKAGESAMFYIAYSLLLQKLQNKGTTIICTDCEDAPMRSIDDEERDIAGQLTSSFREFFTYGGADQCTGMLSSLLDELEKRKADPGRCADSIWWMLIKPEMISKLIDNSNFTIELKELLMDGPKYNIHTVLRSYDVKKAGKLQVENFFDDRLCLEMNSDDMRFVTGRDVKKELVGYKALLAGNRSMSIRLYDTPDKAWINQLFARLNSIIKK